MKPACRINDKMTGGVYQRVIGYETIIEIIDDIEYSYEEPIYCGPASITGTQVTGSNNVFIGGFGAARLGDGGTTTDPCAGSPFTNAQGSSSVIINGSPAVKVGDSVTVYLGYGSMSSGKNDVLIGG